MSYQALEDDDDHVYLNALTHFETERSHVQIFTNHKPFSDITNEIFEYITNICVEGYECDYELDECGGGIYLVVDDRVRYNQKHFKYKWESVLVVIKLRREVLFIEKLYCVSVSMTSDPTNEGDICNADKLALHDECKLEKLTSEISDDNEYGYKYIYRCKCNYTKYRPHFYNVTLYNEEDTILYDGFVDNCIIFEIVNKNHNKFLTFRCYHT